MAWGRGLVVLGVGVVVGRWVLPAAFPFLIALLVALALEPVVSRLEAIGIGRGVGTSLTLGLALAAGAAAAAFLAHAVWGESEAFLRNLPGYYRLAEAAVLGLGDRLGLLTPGQSPGAWQGPVRDALGLAAEVLSNTARALAQLPEIAVGLGLALIAAFFLVRDWPRMAAGLRRSLPPAVRSDVLAVFAAAVGAAAGFLRAQLILVATTAGLVTAGLLVLGSRYAVLLGLAAGLLDIVPVLGATAILLPWGLFLLLTGHVAAGVRLLALLAAVGAVREVVEMKVVGGQVGLHPLAALASMYFGVKLFGPFGIAIGPILVSTGWAVVVGSGVEAR